VDGLHRLFKAYEDFGGGDQAVTTYSYTPHGRLASLADNESNATAYGYDSLGRLTTVTYPDAAGGSNVVSLAYDVAQNKVSRTDQKGITAVLQYDDVYRLVSRVFQDPSQQVVLSESFTYDRSGRMLSAINERAKVYNRYDALGRVIETKHKHLWDGGATSNGFATTFAYDIGANSTRTIGYPAGRTVVETFDPRGRLAELAGGTDVGATWGYDAGDRRTGATLANDFHSQFTYDVNDRVTGIMHYHAAPPFPVPVISHWHEYGYDAVGNRTSLLDLRWQDRSQVYAYDGRHRLTEFRRGEISGDPGAYVIEDNDLLVDGVLPGKQAWDLDSRGNWESLVTLLDGVSSAQTRTHNGANEIEAIDPDGGGQLPAVVYGVDHNGNLTLDPLAPNTGETAPAGQRYEYDAANRLTRVWRTNDAGDPNDDELLLEIGYDALGRRVQSAEHIDAAATGTPPVLSQPKITVHVYAGFEAIEEYDADTNGPGAPTVTLAREFVWGAAFPEPVALIDHTDAGDTSAGTAEVLHYLHDALGSVIGLTDANGTLVERYDYDPYGKTYVQGISGTAPPVSHYANPWMWTGQRFDGITGQYHFWARTLGTHTGRWFQRDRLEYIDGVSFYEYGVSSPDFWLDSLGGEVETTHIRNQVYHHVYRRGEYVGTISYVRNESMDRGGYQEGIDLQRLDRLRTAADFRNFAQDLDRAGTVAEIGARVASEPLDLALSAIEFADDPTLRNAAGLLPIIPGALKKADDLVDVVKIRNGHLAGTTHPVTGIPFNDKGFPDFSSVADKTVEIAQTGDRTKDAKLANEAAGLDKTPEGFIWHHHENGTTMQLVPSDIHQQTGHTGGVALNKDGCK